MVKIENSKKGMMDKSIWKIDLRGCISLNSSVDGRIMRMKSRYLTTEPLRDEKPIRRAGCAVIIPDLVLSG
jgi:hypothetical protein